MNKKNSTPYKADHIKDGHAAGTTMGNAQKFADAKCREIRSKTTGSGKSGGSKSGGY